MELYAVAGVLCIVAVNAIAPRLRLSVPLMLVAIGVLVSLQPFVDAPVVEIDSEIILAGVLPLLLFAAAVQMPAVNFRRNFSSITGLSISLVVLSALALGWFFSAMLPGLGFAGGVAMGAILSPTDAVATQIVKKLGVAPRVVDLLDGEAMLNDASALVLLRSSIAATVTSVTIRSVAWKFLVSILIATLIGIFVGWITLRVRKMIAQPTVNTLLSFAVPFLAFIPAEHLGASGLVAVVAAGLATGHAAPRFLEPTHRINETLNWRTIEMLLEGGLFLLMGLQLFALSRAVQATEYTMLSACSLAGIALLITLVVRAAWAFPLLSAVHHRQARFEKARRRLEDMQQDLVQTPAGRAALDAKESRFVDRIQTRIRRVLADAAYNATTPLRRKDGALIVWAGMRGAITLAAAETLPPEMPHRSLLVLVAFLVAAGSLLIQGGTLGWVIRRLKFPPADHAAAEKEQAALLTEVENAALAVLDDPALRAPDGSAYDEHLLVVFRKRILRADREANDKRFTTIGPLLDRVFDAQRATVLDARNEGIYSSETLTKALQKIDSLQIGIRLANSEGPVGGGG